MFKTLLAVAAITLTAPAFAADGCSYVGDRNGFTAVKTDAGIVISDDGKAIDKCHTKPGTLSLTASCDGGWHGKVFFAGSGPTDIAKGAIMVLEDEVWFRVCR